MFKFTLILTMAPMIIALIGCGSDDDGSIANLPADGNLLAMAECATDGFRHLGFAINTSLILFHELENYPPYTPPFGFGYNPDTGIFGYEMALGADPLQKTRIEGIVSPLSVVADGLQQHDNFSVAWTLKPSGGADVLAGGSFRVIHNGLTLPPGQTETLRVIPAAEIWSGPEGGCRTEFGQFELTVHHLLAEDEIRNALTSFVCSGPIQSCRKTEPGGRRRGLLQQYDLLLILFA